MTAAKGMILTDDGAAARPAGQLQPSFRRPPAAYDISGLNK